MEIRVASGCSDAAGRPSLSPRFFVGIAAPTLALAPKRLRSTNRCCLFFRPRTPNPLAICKQGAQFSATAAVTYTKIIDSASTVLGRRQRAAAAPGEGQGPGRDGEGDCSTGHHAHRHQRFRKRAETGRDHRQCRGPQRSSGSRERRSAGPAFQNTQDSVGRRARSRAVLTQRERSHSSSSSVSSSVSP